MTKRPGVRIALLSLLTASLALAGTQGVAAAPPVKTPALSLTCGTASTDVVGNSSWKTPDSLADGPLAFSITSAKGLTIDYIYVYVGPSSGGMWWQTKSSAATSDGDLGISGPTTTTLLNQTDGTFQPKLQSSNSYRAWVPNYGYLSGETYELYVYFKKGATEIKATCVPP